MKIKKLVLKNIRSYKDGEIIFPEGSILLAGDIGTGKTSILLAIEYSLFGLQPGQRGASLLRNGADHGLVSLEMEIGGRNILIERKLKRNYKTITNEYASISVDNEKIEASLTEIKIKILEWMGYPQEFVKKNNILYRYTVYTPQEQMKQIILEDAETRLNILRHVLGVDKYKRIRENLLVLLSHLKEESKVLQGEIKPLEDEKEKFELKKSGLKILEYEIEGKAQELESRKSKVREIESETSQFEGKIKEKEYLEKDVDKIKMAIANKHENIATIGNELKEIAATIADIGEIFDEKHYQNILDNLYKKDRDIEILNLNYTSLLSEISSLEKQKDETLAKKNRIFKIEICPTCLQDVPEIHKHNILNEIESILSKTKQKILFLSREVSIIIKTLENTKKEKYSLEEQKTAKEILRTKLEYLGKVEKRKKILLDICENFEKDIALLDRQIISIKEKILDLSRFDNLIRIKKKELQQAVQEERKTEISLAEIKKELELTKIELIYLEESINKKEKSKQDLTYLLEVHDWLSSDFLQLIEFTERNVLLKLRQEFSRVFSKWFNMLVASGPLSVRLDESFSPIMLHNDIEMEYSFLSGGERTAVALAYRLALNQTINSIMSRIKTKDIVVLDEPTEG